MAAELPAPEVSGYPEPLVRFAAEAWPMRAAEEDRSQRLFLALAEGSGVPLRAFRDRFSSAAADEAAHRELCVRVGAAFGAPAPVFDVTPVERRVAALPASPWQRAASLVAIEVAVGETLSASLFSEGVRGATEPCTAWALGAIVKDEVRHAALGWEALEALLPLGSEEERAALREELRLGLGELERAMAGPSLRRLEAGEPFDARLSELGVLAPEARVEAFYRAMESKVLPRLDQLGLDGTRAWERRYQLEGQ